MARYSSEKQEQAPYGLSEPLRSPASTPPDREARIVAEYIADMAAQLESMARSANLELVSYLLSMAGAEAESAARGTELKAKRG